MKRNILLLILALGVFVGCANRALVTTQTSLPKENMSISLFQLKNYTDTPRAGMRSSNIIEGILLTKGYQVTSHIFDDVYTFNKAKQRAKEDNSKYFFIGGVSEWRYKTGIDGEPAVSLQCSIYTTNDGQLVWSATGANSDWGNASIGTTAQNLIQTMMID
ncbi:MAG: hypothetical protein COB42_05380 [Sulfurimonas sp.]|nr:MAG: hypothetical protein COB42_05380 [Sulfurimonas sp.]